MTTCRINIPKESLAVNNVVELADISKKYPIAQTLNREGLKSGFSEFWALKDISLEAFSGQIMGIIGRNGAGKTTLLNIIAGTLSPTQGRIMARGKVLGLFNLGVGFQDELTGKENIFLNAAILGATRKETEGKLEAIIEFSELGDFINMPLGTYSQGMRLRLGFSIIANLNFDILVIDEVLAVGDTLFQNKCFQRLMDFRRSGKTLIITTQSMDLIERLCDRVALLDHGRLVFCGNPIESVQKYRILLNTGKFFVGPDHEVKELFTNTKKWADDISGWQQKLGTKEAVIESVRLINKFGITWNRIKSRDPLKIKVNFRVKNTIKEPHFGVAIFRNDGVYCYGPNTVFEGYEIPELRTGKGFFILYYHHLLLSPGEYRISVAIWDKNEALAFDYHAGYYKLIVKGHKNEEKELLNMPFQSERKRGKHAFLNLFKKIRKPILNLSLLSEKKIEVLEDNKFRVESVKMLDTHGQIKDVFFTNEQVKIVVDFSCLDAQRKDSYLWLGLFRDDGVYCQGMTAPFIKDKNFVIIFPRLSLLPGGYAFSLGVWDNAAQKFLMHQRGIHAFRMVFNQQDHGTVYLPHKWRWKIKGEK